MYHVYVLQSEKDGKFYVGYSENLKDRLELHNAGKVISTKNRRPLKLVYDEACINQKDALHREKYLKTSYGKRYIKNRLKGLFHGVKDTRGRAKRNLHSSSISLLDRSPRQSTFWIFQENSGTTIKISQKPKIYLLKFANCYGVSIDLSNF